MSITQHHIEGAYYDYKWPQNQNFQIMQSVGTPEKIENWGQQGIWGNFKPPPRKPVMFIVELFWS